MTKEQFLKLKVGDKLIHPERGVYRVAVDINKGNDYSIWRLEHVDGKTWDYITDDDKWRFQDWNLRPEIVDLI